MPVDQVKAAIDSEAIAEDMKVKKAVDLVKEKASITKKRKTAAKKSTAKKTTKKAEETPAEDAPAEETAAE